MKRCGPCLFVGFVLAILLIPGLHPVRLTRVFLDSPSGRASCLDVSRLLVPAVAAMVPAVQPAKLWCPRKRDGVGLALTNVSSPFQLLPTTRRYAQTIPVRLGSTSAGLQCWFERPPRLKLQGPPGPPVGLRRGTLPVRTCENRGSRKNRASATCNFYDRL